jgi:hypothetical protein
MDEFGDNRLVHFCVPTKFESSLLWFLIRGEDKFYVDIHKSNLLIGYQGSISSEIVLKRQHNLLHFYFYYYQNN